VVLINDNPEKGEQSNDCYDYDSPIRNPAADPSGGRDRAAAMGFPYDFDRTATRFWHTTAQLDGAASVSKVPVAR
jgi:hypothetical protein